MNYDFYGEMRPYKHQEETIKFMLKNKRGYLWLDMGTGKTATSLWFFDILVHNEKASKILIIAPLSTLDVVWAKEVRNICPYRKYVIVHGTREKRIEALNSDAKIFISNTDAVRNFEKEFIDLKPDILIIDEVTSFSNAQSKRSKSLQKLSKTVKAVYGLSGSPVAGGLMNSFGIAKAINPANLPTQYFSKYRDMIMSQVNLYEYIPKEGAERIVNKALSPAIKYSLEDCTDLPEIVFEERYVKLPSDTMKAFNDMLRHQIAEVKAGLITAATAGVKMIRLIQILTGSTKTEEGELFRTNINPKLEELLDIYHEGGQKLVVFAQSVEAVKLVTEFLKSKKVHAELIYGDISLIKRKHVIDEFQSRKDGVLVAQVKTMSHGITLTAAHTLVFFGPIMGNETLRQAIRRIRRIGQAKRQVIVKLLSTKFEAKVFEKMDQTELSAQSVLDIYHEDIIE